MDEAESRLLCALFMIAQTFCAGSVFTLPAAVSTWENLHNNLMSKLPGIGAHIPAGTAPGHESRKGEGGLNVFIINFQIVHKH